MVIMQVSTLSESGLGVATSEHCWGFARAFFFGQLLDLQGFGRTLNIAHQAWVLRVRDLRESTP